MRNLNPAGRQLLVALRRSGALDADRARSVRELVEAGLLPPGGFSSPLEKLRSAYLVERRPKPGDKQATLWWLTVQGVARAEHID